MEASKNRIIQLSLRKPRLENYLRFIFNSPDGPIKVTRCEVVGQYLYSRVRYNLLPQKGPKSGHIIELLMPDHPLDQSQNHFINYSEDDMVRINDFIESFAYMDFIGTVQVGYHEMSIEKKTLINIYSNLVFGEDKYEMLKKSEYRRRKKMMDWVVKSVQTFGY